MNSSIPFAHQPHRRDSRRAAIGPDAVFLSDFKQALLQSDHCGVRPDCCSFFTYPEDSDPIVSSNSAFPSTFESNDADTSNANSHVQQQGIEETHLQGIYQPRRAQRQLSGLKYPLFLFADFPSLPNNQLLNGMLEQFHNMFVPYTPFLRFMDLPKTGAPPYLILPMALLGATVSKNTEHSLWTTQLHRATNALIVGVLEVDNSMARSMEWIIAMALTIMYGITQADLHTWRKSQEYSGYLDTIFHRVQMKDHLADTESSTVPINKVQNETMEWFVGYYFLIDTIRTVHLNTPRNLTPNELSLPVSSGHNFKTLFQTLVVDLRPLPTTLQSDHYLLLLLALLSEAISLSQIFGGLLARSKTSQQNAWKSMRASWFDDGHDYAEHSEDQSQPERGSEAQSAASQNPSYSNPFLRFSARSEYFRNKSQLNRALHLWCQSTGISFNNSSNEMTRVDHSVVSLMHFCRIMIEAGPEISLILDVVGYRNSPPQSEVDTLVDIQKLDRFAMAQWCRENICINNISLSSAWQLLESVEMVEERSYLPITPAWFPFAVFYAALVVWARMVCDEEYQNASGSEGGIRRIDDHVLLPRRRLLGIFQSKLEGMKSNWGCAVRMAEVIKFLK